MASYRLYCMDGVGHIGLAEWIEADSDVAAIAEAHRVRGEALNCEVWQGSRLVASFSRRDPIAELAERSDPLTKRFENGVARG